MAGSFLEQLPVDAIQLQYTEVGQLHSSNEGIVHTKSLPFTSIVQPTHGRYGIECRGQSAMVEEGEVFLIGANIPHSITHHDGPSGLMQAHWLFIRATLYGTIDLTTLLNLPLHADHSWGELFREIIEKIRSLQSENGINALHRVLALQEQAFKALRLLCEFAPVRGDLPKLLSGLDRLTPVFSYIHEHLTEEISPEILARQAHLSRSRFHTLFKEKMTISPMEYVKRQRLLESCNLLMTSDLPLYNVAERCGFQCVFHFSREFKHIYGCSPTTYRKLNRQR